MRTITFASLLSVALAQVAKYTPSSDTSITYSVNVPSSTASGGSGPIYIQLTGPTTKSWIALGQGSQMSGSQMFILYTDGQGNVTLSPRLGGGHFEPTFNSAAQVTLLEGTGVNNGVMTANIRCDSCLSWSGGTMSVTNTKSSWIWAMKSGSEIGSTSTSADIDQHDVHGNFNFDLTKATGGSSSNPFITVAASPSAATSSSAASGAGQSSTAGASQASSTAVTAGTGPNDNSDEGSTEDDGQQKLVSQHDKIHGIVMGIAFAILFPLGAILIRVIPSSKVVTLVHVPIQIIAYILAVVGMAYGILLAKETQALTSAHPIIGLVVVAGLFFQIVLGAVHHAIYVKRHVKTFWATAHVTWGRCLVILGIINGGLGLQLAANTTGGETAYGVVAGVMSLLWLGAVVLHYMKKRKNSSTNFEK